MNRFKFFSYTFALVFIFVIALTGLFAIKIFEEKKITDSKTQSTSNISKTEQKIDYTKRAQFGKKIIYLAFAKSESDQIKGLSFEPFIKDDQGLLFVFEKQDKYGIWMKDMNFPIDVFWLDSKMRVLFIKENFLPSSFPEIIYPTAFSSFVLETASGYAKVNEIKIGDQLKIFEMPE